MISLLFLTTDRSSPRPGLPIAPPMPERVAGPPAMTVAALELFISRRPGPIGGGEKQQCGSLVCSSLRFRSEGYILETDEE